MKSIVCATAAVLAAGLLASVPVQAAPAQPLSHTTPRALDRDKPIRMELTACANAESRDCIESISLVSGGAITAARLITPGVPVVYAPVKPDKGQTGPVGGPAIDRYDIWQLPGLVTESGIDTFDPFIAITTPGMRWYNAETDSEYDVPAQVNIELLQGAWVNEPATPPCNPDGTCGRPELKGVGQTFRVVLRTSWFAPAVARSHLADTILKIERLADGGSRLTVQGEALNSPGFYWGGGRNPAPEEREQFDYYDYRWTVYMMDANDPRFPEKCASKGFPLISGNQWGGGTPMWSPRTQEMNLVMSAPHLDGDGKAFRGHYEAFIPAAYARCLWQADPQRLQSRLMVEVTGEEGEEKAASTSIAFRDGGVRIVARNFTFSSPKITVRPKNKRR
jgi:hypothetical protein